MSHLKDDVQAHFHSGEPHTTGREPFEDSTATGPGQAYTAGNTSGDGQGVMSSTTIPGQGQRGEPRGNVTDRDHASLNHPHGHQGGLTSNEQGQHHGTHGGNSGVGAAAAGAGAAATTGHQHGQGHHEHGQGHHHEHGQGQGLSGSTPSGQYGSVSGGGQGAGSGVGTRGQSGATRIDEDTRGTGETGIHRGQHEGGHYGVGSNENSARADRAGGNERVGELNQGGHLYERTGESGPVTGGAAGTDRFDTDKHRSGAGIGGTGHSGQAGYGGRNEGETTTRGEGKGTGGIGGVLGTTDKEFAASDRLGKGAYNDDEGRFQSNTHGPGGSALTGREGDLSKNPVAQNQGSTGATTAGTGPGGHGVGHEDDAQKKGIVEKLKDAFT